VNFFSERYFLVLFLVNILRIELKCYNPLPLHLVPKIIADLDVETNNKKEKEKNLISKLLLKY